MAEILRAMSVTYDPHKELLHATGKPAYSRKEFEYVLAQATKPLRIVKPRLIGYGRFNTLVAVDDDYYIVDIS